MFHCLGGGGDATFAFEVLAIGQISPPVEVSLERPTPVLRRLRHFHTVHLAFLVSDPGGSSSLDLSAIAFFLVEG